MNTDLLDFIVVNATSNYPVAAFLLPNDALTFIKFRRTKSPGGPEFNVANKDGTPTSPELAAAVKRANCFNLFEGV